MAPISLKDSASAINLFQRTYNDLVATHAKADALIEFVLAANLEETTPHTLRHVLWILQDLIIESTRLCDEFKGLQEMVPS